MACCTRRPRLLLLVLVARIAAVLALATGLYGGDYWERTWLRDRARDSWDLRVLYPGNEGVTTQSFTFRFVASMYQGHSGGLATDLMACLEVDGRRFRCVPLPEIDNHSVKVVREMVMPSVDELSLGRHTARVYFERREVPGQRIHESPQTTFTIVNNSTFAQFTQEPQRTNRWMASVAAEQHRWLQDPDFPTNTASAASKDALLLVIGVKTSVQKGFPMRQAIRETWASKATLPGDVRMFFLGCRVADDPFVDPERARVLNEAVEVEKSVYGDLLTSELVGCEDSYSGLVDKVTAFFAFATAAFPNLSFLMVADDDIYLHVERLVQRLRPRTPQRFYAGQVWEEQFQRHIMPERDPSSQYYLPKAAYPLEVLPAFAYGPHVILSADCARYIAANRQDFAVLASLDDVAVALWMLAIQIHPQHLSEFQNLRDSACVDDTLVSLADLSVGAIHAIHDNLLIGRPFCHGYTFSGWIN
ncbi:hypothetical protein BBJ28_00021111 [Nothophytophthora sp. Chile5]|nr:hypothetical protein BBJ28_00021111 [Nothophytophthora sp. Chile5]